jgi:tRNA(Ile)-lysidine synthase
VNEANFNEDCLKDGSVHLPEELFRFLENTFPARLCVACSGGSDSVALLVLLCKEASLRDRLIVLHFNHRTRGNTSDGDADFVKNFASAAHVPIVVGHLNDDTRGYFGEDLLRRHRFYFFRREMSKLDTPYLLTGHNRDDVIETFLMRLARGSSVDGLTALRAVEHRCDGYIYVRPLLSFSKNALREYLLKMHILWREDSSNASECYLRNRVRHKLIPAWKNIESGRSLESCLLHARALLVEDADALKELSEGCFRAICHENRLDLEALRRQPIAVLRRVLHLFFLNNGRVLERAFIDHLLDLCQVGEPFKASVTTDLVCVSTGREIYLQYLHRSSTL